MAPIWKRLYGIWWVLFKDHYCVVAYYPADQSCDVYSFRSPEAAEEYIEGIRILYGWAEDVEWHVRPLFTPAVRRGLIKDAVAGRRGRIMDRNYKPVPPKD
jgi:hypothetical protein